MKIDQHGSWVGVVVPYWQENDTFHDDPRWAALAAGQRVTVDQLQAAYARLMSVAARHMSNGWLTAETAANLARPTVLERLTARPLADEPPFLHSRGDECACWEEWRAGYDYLLHRFLKRNPAKKETERHRAQKAERESPQLRAQVYERDSGCCRYCRSGPLKRSGMGRAKDRRRVIQYDHVDPDALAGADLANLVVACARCNERKGNRTPDEADMVLLPVPTAAERAAFAARAEPGRLDPPARPAGNSASDSAATAPSTADRTAVGTAVATAVPTADPGAVTTGELCPETGADQPRQRPATGSEGAGSGRVGQPGAVGVHAPAGQPRRTPDSPDIYHRRARDLTRAPPQLRDPPPLDEHLPEGEP